LKNWAAPKCEHFILKKSIFAKVTVKLSAFPNKFKFIEAEICIKFSRMPTFDPDPTTPYWRYSSIRYPKAGTRNPTADLFVVDLTDLSNQKTSILIPPIIIRQRFFKQKNQYIFISFKVAVLL